MSRILIVDDEKSIRCTLGAFLRAEGHEVSEAGDADAALQRLGEAAFDVVVTDIILPRVTGVELLRRIHAAAPHVQVVMMTGEPTVETASESLRAGAADYLFKPIDKAAILRVIANAVRLKTLDDTRRRLEAENRAHQENLERLVDERTGQLRASEERARELSRFNQAAFDALSAHICVLAEDGTILAVNRAWEEFRAANPPLAARAGLGANYLRVCQAVTGGDEATAREAVRGLLAVARGDLPEFSLEYPCHSPDTPRWFLMRGTRFAGEGPVRLVVAHVNITARRQAEEAVRFSEERYRTLVETARDVIFTVSPEGLITSCSAQLVALAGWTREEWLGRSFEGLVDADDLPRARALFARALLGSQIPAFELRLRTKTGGCVPTELNVTTRYEDGRVLEFLGVARDVRDRQRAEQHLRDSEALYSSLVGNLPQQVFRKDRAGRFTFGNAPFCQSLGKPLAEILGKTDVDFFPSPLAAKYRQDDQSVMETGRSFEGEEEHYKADGRTIWVNVIKTPLRDAAGQIIGLQGISWDISDRKESDRRMTDALNFNRTIIESSPIGIITYRASGEALLANPSVAQMLGGTREALVAQNFRELDSWKRSGLLVAAEQALATRSEQQLEVHAESTFGKQFWFNCRLVPFTHEGQPHLLLLAADVTETKLTEAKFLRAQRLEGVGSLASGLAHDLNNILAPVLMIAPLLRDTVPDADSRAMLDTIEGCAQRGAAIIKQLLTFARGTPGARVPLPARHLLRELEKIIRETFPRDIRPSVDASKDLWLVLGDATQIHQALLNLCVNARDAMPDGGTLTLGARNVVVDAAFAAMSPGAKPGPYVCVSVTDTGTGVLPEDLDRIFDPFFTTKEPGKGTGLGLATVLGIVRGHEGFLQVDSPPGHGTTFDLYFPASPQAQVVQTAARETAPPRAHGELILLVDDEAAVLDGLRRTLEPHGYRVVTARNGAEGLAAFSLHRAAVRAVLTDMMMPVMNGPEMIHALRALDPSLPILGMTGLPDRKGVKGFERIELSVLLAKPFSGDELLRVLHATLQAPEAAAPPDGTS